MNRIHVYLMTALSCISSLYCISGWSLNSSSCVVGRGWEAAASILYWQPNITPYPVGWINNNTQPSRVQLPLLTRSPKFSLGFRLEANWTSCSCLTKALIEWSHLCSSAPKTYTSNIPFLVFSFSSSPQTTRAKTSFNNQYDKVAVKVSRYIAGNGCARLDGVAEANYLRFYSASLVKFVDLTNVFHSISAKRSFYAGGVGIGLRLTYFLGSCWNVLGEANFISALGKRKRTVFDYSSAFSFYENTTPKWGCTFGTEARLLLRYSRCCCKWLITGEIGYEYRQYFTPFPMLSSAPAISGASPRFGIGGPLATLRLGF